MDRQDRGTTAETQAADHLIAAGLRPLARNVGFRFGEVDLVMLQEGMIVFVEVRYRSRSGFGGAAASVDVRKRRRLAKAAGAWLAGQPRLQRMPCRFDVVAISGETDDPDIEWIRNAFTLDDLA